MDSPDNMKYGDTGCFCPLLSMNQSQKVACDSKCAWFYVGEHDMGGCALYMMSKYAQEISER